METDRSNICGCKGIRTCLKCEALFSIQPKYKTRKSGTEYDYSYCPKCELCWRGWNNFEHGIHEGDPVQLNGVHIVEDFLSQEEEIQLLNDLDLLNWEPSQSGRRKQNFGPRCNFKKRKLRIGSFNGFPECTKFIHEKFKNVDILNDFHTVEQCTLEYDPQRGASIDPHIDDCWIWGERIVTVNLLADSVLTLTPYLHDKDRYNLQLAPFEFKQRKNVIVEAVRIPLIRRSLIVLTGEARYSWLHQIYREDICTRRVCLAFREFTSPFLPGGEHSEEGKKFLEIAKHFWK